MLPEPYLRIGTATIRVLKVKKDEMTRACSTYGEEEKYI
jgi:hypothetical protein